MKEVLPSPGNQCDAGVRRPGEDVNYNDHEGDLCQLPLTLHGLLLDQGGFPHLGTQTLHLPAGRVIIVGHLTVVCILYCMSICNKTHNIHIAYDIRVTIPGRLPYSQKHKEIAVKDDSQWNEEHKTA